MNIKHLFPIIALSAATISASAQNNTAKAILFAEHQTKLLLKQTAETKKTAAKPNLLSPRTVENGKLTIVSPKDWCSGFFAGNLWFLYEYTGDKFWKEQSEPFTTVMEQEKSNIGTHDLGFMVYNSVGNAYRLTNEQRYKDDIIQAANSLITRFNPTIGCIKSWDHQKQWQFPVIIDNMMNLELLFEATKLSGDSSFYKVAVIHANTTLKNHFRADNSSYHVINYDPATGQVLNKQTAQGFADSSAWARGQAWGLYGYTMCYRETKNKIYLQQAEKIAKYIFSNPQMPADLVPYWDFDAAKLGNQPRDASAAAIAASALYELSTFSKNARVYKNTADKILNSLATKYQAQTDSARGFLLLHSTGHKPANSEIDVPIIYADYYYLEALLRQKRLAEKKPVLNISGRLKN
ncbi:MULTISPECIES: glycoside hydrolase family 88 protein [unclassified Mucilaginibacter]|uniref:glycoside hydrolase family 88 protein n=1 Tax=unclassified Mucilaginibacter TaxID=2617802 RepID=UPI002AC8B952|nr:MULTISPECIES: glycoside hydrolase family 88 protein [unclassified Mucilaginibacter]MEB0278096.1 glycoside hydrolase family 88 protein [Mucilaginibacter sp. 10B2]MEB0301754.1 glycoside hydrolase family 88 protein [Mucilaginibacter sp. 5C4]WPX23007.1 glycoside hydrolase family 88 protein [Mucilaginibacter sp. 5C4]